MKNTKLLLTILLITAASFLLSCEDSLALGSRLDLEGPSVTITSPIARQPVDGLFKMTGTVAERGNSANSVIDYVLVRAKYSKESKRTPGEFRDTDYEIRWRLTFPSGLWEASFFTYDDVYEESGAWGDWEPVEEELVYEGTPGEELVVPGWAGTNKQGSFVLPINMGLFNHDFKDGQYIFSVTAWDAIGNSDDHSYKTVMVIISKTLPEVEVILPELFTGGSAEEITEWNKLVAILDSDVAARQNPLNIGKFITGEFPLQWLIESQSDVWSIDIRFYDALETNWDNHLGDYNYRYKLSINGNKQLTPTPDLDDILRPFYRFTIPDLTQTSISSTNGPAEQELTSRITGKITLRVVVRCTDVTGKTILEDEMDKGLFIYWPDANKPWIEFPGGLRETYHPLQIYTLYPNSQMPIRAFDNNGVKEVRYSVYKVTDVLGNTELNPIEGYNNVTVTGTETRVFTWNFFPPLLSDDYKITATVFDVDGLSETASGYFRVMDVSYPEIDPPITPISAEPLYNFIKCDLCERTPLVSHSCIDNWYIDIIGYASDNMGINNVAMVWINPQSPNYAAMSQLAYFRDPDYAGWAKAPANASAPPGQDTEFSTLHPNLVWRMELGPPEMDWDTNRQLFRYSKRLFLKRDLNIAPGEEGMNYLKSQVFVLKATKNDLEGKATIISWSPQGDASAPQITINQLGVNIIRTGNPVPEPLEKGVYTIPIAQLGVGDRITIEGTWREDSTTKLPVNIVFNPFLEVTINKLIVPLSNITFTANPGNASGTWKADIAVTATGTIPAGNLKDALVIGAKFIDIGGNPSEDSASWLVESDALRFLRIGSDTRDGTYTHFDGTPGNPTKINIFLEFNKPVRLLNPSQNPVLLLNVGGAAGIATYVSDHEDYDRNPERTSTKQHFTYTVENGHNVDKLTVIGIQGTDSGWNTPGYNYTWVTFQAAEEIRMVTRNPQSPPISLPGPHQHIGWLPTRTTPNTPPTDLTGGHYALTLMAGKSIGIDTTAPQIRAQAENGVTRTPNTGYYNRGDNERPNTLYITLNFNESITIDESNKPRLRLNIINGANTEAFSDDVMINADRLIFSYVIKNGDYSGNIINSFSALQITGLTGGPITDLAGNLFTPGAGLFSESRMTFTGLFVDTIAPSVPLLRIISGGNIVGSSTVATNLGTVYYDDLSLRLISNPAVNPSPFDFNRVEYKSGDGEWVIYNSAQGDVPFDPGIYSLVARQVDNAGNASPETPVVRFDWDQGPLLQRVSSSASNGIKTNTSRAYDPGDPLIRIDQIPIVLTFRKPVEISAISFTLNIRNTNTGTTTRVFIPATISAAANASFDRRTWTFTYSVGEYDSTNLQLLNVTALTATASEALYTPDGNNPYGTFTGLGQDVSNMIDLVFVNDTTGGKEPTNLGNLKEITIQTGFPELVSATLTPSETANSDDSVDARLVLVFDRNIFQLSGNVSVIQEANGYRLPAVLSEIQRNRYRGQAGLGSVIFDSYYDRGTNGFISTGAEGSTTGSADTTTKFTLKFVNDTYNITPSTATTAAGTTAQRDFAEAFRQAERSLVGINTSAVTVAGTTVTIRLEGTNALKVRGAAYEVVFGGGLVQDEIGFPSQAYNSSTPGIIPQLTGRQLAGISRPTIRVHKPQERIEIAGTPSTTQPRLVATQPGLAQIRMDCRTPNSRVSYTTTNNTTGDTSISWGGNFTQNPPVLPTPTANPAQPGIPTSGTNIYGSTTPAAVASLPIGTAADNGRFNGYRYRIRATGMTGTGGTAVYGAAPYAEEIAYRTVVIFTGSDVLARNGQTFTSGDALWIRGGNTMTSTTIPGFPLTPDDNWEALRGTLTDCGECGGCTATPTPTACTNRKWVGGSRAGIRLMSRIAGTNLVDSEWQWVTWDMVAPAFFQLYLGNDNSSSPDQAYQYGPLNYAVNIGNWTNLREYYRVFPGQRRMLGNNTPNYTIDAGGFTQHNYTFNASFSTRPNHAATITQPSP